MRPLALVLPALAASVDLTYKIEWSITGNALPESAAVVPIDGMPSAHPKVKGQICGVIYSPGEAIPSISQWSESGRSSSGGDCKFVTSGEMFYAYDYPKASSGNSGYNKVRSRIDRCGWQPSHLRSAHRPRPSTSPPRTPPRTPPDHTAGQDDVRVHDRRR